MVEVNLAAGGLDLSHLYTQRTIMMVSAWLALTVDWRLLRFDLGWRLLGCGQLRGFKLNPTTIRTKSTNHKMSNINKSNNLRWDLLALMNEDKYW